MAWREWGTHSGEEHAAKEALDRAQRELDSCIKHYGDDPRKAHKIEEARRDRDAAERQLRRSR